MEYKPTLLSSMTLRGVSRVLSRLLIPLTCLLLTLVSSSEPQTGVIARLPRTSRAEIVARAPEDFDRKLAKGSAAGAHSRYGVLSCAAGIDCSGFVTLCWGLSASGHAYSTSNLREIAGKPRYNWFTDMKPGDVLNLPGSHVVLFTGYNPDGTINVCEASGSKARVVCHGSTWSRFKRYIPLQYKGIDE